MTMITNREFRLEPVRTYASIENARKAVEKFGDAKIRHTYVQCDSRWFPVFFPTVSELSETGVHFRWNVVGPLAGA